MYRNLPAGVVLGLEDEAPFSGATSANSAEELRVTLKRSINTVATTLIAILALYIFGVAAIKDFALPLIVGIACGCYSSIFVASPLWVVFQKKFKNTRYNTKQQKKNNRKRRDKRQEKAPQV